jgi:hypothetical protein
MHVTVRFGEDDTMDAQRKIDGWQNDEGPDMLPLDRDFSLDMPLDIKHERQHEL